MIAGNHLPDPDRVSALWAPDAPSRIPPSPLPPLSPFGALDPNLAASIERFLEDRHRTEPQTMLTDRQQLTAFFRDLAGAEIERGRDRPLRDLPAPHRRRAEGAR